MMKVIIESNLFQRKQFFEMLIVTCECIFIKPKRDEVNIFINDTIQKHSQKYGNTYWKKSEFESNINFYDKIENKTKNITTKRGVQITIVASNGRYDFVKINRLIILIKGNI